MGKQPNPLCGYAQKIFGKLRSESSISLILFLPSMSFVYHLVIDWRLYQEVAKDSTVYV